MANGFIAVEGKRKKVQHLEGGIVERVDVRDGDTVKAGQVLAVLNQTETSAALGVLLSELDAVVALEARLQAETRGCFIRDVSAGLAGAQGHVFREGRDGGPEVGFVRATASVAR